MFYADNEASETTINYEYDDKYRLINVTRSTSKNPKIRTLKSIRYDADFFLPKSITYEDLFLEINERTPIKDGYRYSIKKIRFSDEFIEENMGRFAQSVNNDDHNEDENVNCSHSDILITSDSTFIENFYVQNTEDRSNYLLATSILFDHKLNIMEKDVYVHGFLLYSISYEYDSKGRIKSIRDKKSDIDYYNEYDELGNPIVEYTNQFKIVKKYEKNRLVENRSYLVDTGNLWELVVYRPNQN
jgi:hypothetical protein